MFEDHADSARGVMGNRNRFREYRRTVRGNLISKREKINNRGLEKWLHRQMSVPNQHPIELRAGIILNTELRTAPTHVCLLPHKPKTN